MLVVLIPAAANAQSALAELIQLYRCELGKLNGSSDHRCDNHLRIGAALSDPGLQPFLIQVDQQLAGFALSDHLSRLQNPFDGRSVADFFVVRRFRRQGVGRTAATALFDRFPGRWEVSSCASNVPGHVFWRGVVDRYTGGNYAETWFQNACWRGPVQSFVTPAH